MTRGWFCTCSTEPSASTEPSCNTVTLAARLRTNAMSCSTTTIVRSCARLRISSAVASVSRSVMPATGSSSSNSRRSWIKSMPISSHCFWPWLKAPAGMALLSARPIRSSVAAIGREAGEQGSPGATAVGQRQFEVFDDGQVFEHGRPLELAADAEIGDLRLVEPRQILAAAKEHFAGIGAGLAGDDIHHRRLAGAVGADDRA